MAGEYSNKVLLITENSRIMTPIRHALNRQGLEIAADYLNLHSVTSMKKGAVRTKKTAFLRSELSRFIKERGFPVAIIMDAQLDLGFDSAVDPDQIKHLKALLLTYIIIGKGKEYGHCRGNFILITKGKSFEERLRLGGGTMKLLDYLITDSEVINSYIGEMKADPDRFNERFFIKLMDSQLSSDQIAAFVETFVRGVNMGKTAAGEPPAQEESAPAPAAPEKAAPARLVYRLDSETLYDDGTVGRIPAELMSLREREFYLIGAWTSDTELEVSRKIAAVVQKGLGDTKRFNFNEEILFNIDDRCFIDKNTTLSMAQSFVKNLAAYKKIALRVSEKHGKVVTKSRGFPIIKDRTTVEGEAPPPST